MDYSGNFWRAIPEVEGLYLVSATGLIKNAVTGTLRVTTINWNGYPCVTLPFLTGKKSVAIHRLVAAAFLKKPEGVDGKLEVNHVDGDKTNSSITNFEWVTRGQNIAHAYRIGLRRFTNSQLCGLDQSGRIRSYETIERMRKAATGKYQGEANPAVKLSNEKVLSIRTKLPSCTISALSREYGVSRRLIRNIRDGKAWKHLLTGDR